MNPHLKVYSYKYLLMAAQRAYLRACGNDKDKLVDCMEVVLFSALSLEAFLNHIGPTIFQAWTPLKKKLSPREKLDVLLGHCNRTVDFSHRPFQSFTEAFQIRNELAHAETDYVPFPEPTGQSQRLPETSWMRKCKFDTAQRILEDAISIQRELPGLLGIPLDAPGFLLAETVIRSASDGT